MDTLGRWASNEVKLDQLKERFLNAKPYPHVVISDFFSADVANQIESRFPVPEGHDPSHWKTQGWHVNFARIFLENKSFMNTTVC